MKSIEILEKPVPRIGDWGRVLDNKLSNCVFKLSEIEKQIEESLKPKIVKGGVSDEIHRDT